MAALPGATIVLGDPRSSTHQIDPVLLAQWMTERELSEVLSGDIYFEDTLANLEAVSSPAEGASGVVIDDGTASNNGMYRFESSSWGKTSDLPAGLSLSALATVASTGSYDDLSDKPTLGTAAAAATGDFATAAQGTTADSAVQPGADVSVLAETSTAKIMTGDERSKLAGIAASATANATDANLRDRTTHTGAQAISTVTGLQAALDSKAADTALQPDDMTTSGTALATGDPEEGRNALSVRRDAKTFHYPDRSGLSEITVDSAGRTLAAEAFGGEIVSGKTKVFARPSLYGFINEAGEIDVAPKGAPVEATIEPDLPLSVWYGEAEIVIYRHIRGKVWMRWTLVHVDDDDINADCWHTESIWEVQHDGDGFTDVMNLTHGGSEVEVAVLIDGKPEHSGGSAHGNQEIVGSLTVLVDGAVAASGSGYECSSLTILQQSQLLEPGDTSETKYDPVGDAFVDLSTRWTFRACEGGISLDLHQHFDFLASHLLVNGYVGMMPVKRISNVDGFEGYYVTQFAARAPKWEVEDCYPTSFTEIEDNSDHLKIWGGRFGAEVEIKAGWLATSTMLVDNRSNYNKVYPDFLDGLTPTIGETFTTRVSLSATINSSQEISA